MRIHTDRDVVFGILFSALALACSSGDGAGADSKDPATEGDSADSTGVGSDAANKPSNGSSSVKADAGRTSAKDAGQKLPTPADAAKTPDPSADSDAAAGLPGDESAASTPHEGSTCLQAGSGKYTEKGPYQVAMMDVDLGTIESSQHTGKFTIFYPSPLETSCLHPIVAWGNGTTVMGSSVYAFFNSNAASWGMVVIASQEDNTGSGAFHKAGLDYLLKQNGDPASPFYKKLSTRAGVAGHSQGGFGATQGSQHPNVEALVSIAGGGVPKAKVATMCLTGTKDMVEAPCTQEFMAASGPAFLGDWEGGDHTNTETIGGYLQKDPGSLQMQRLYAAWFRCFLADDQTACAMFKGAPDSCSICKDMGWAKLQARNM